MAILKIQKRNGDLADFDRERIESAIRKAALATAQATPQPLTLDPSLIPSLVDRIVSHLEKRFGHIERLPNVEHIQDIVEQELIAAGFFEVARNYILYRAHHAQLRAEQRIEELRKIEREQLRVVKRDGSSEVFRVSKLERAFAIAARGLKQECPFPQVYERFKLTLVENIPTAQIMKNLRKVCLDLVTVQNIHWQLVAGRLYIMDLYKSACRNRQMDLKKVYSPEAFKEHFDHYIRIGRYARNFYDYYSPDDILSAGKALNKERDLSYIYSTVLSFDRRYLLNPNKDIRELPQEMYMAIALFLAIPEPAEKRLTVSKQIYEVTSSQKLSLPTPTLLNARTNFHQLSSCFKLNVNDDLRARVAIGLEQHRIHVGVGRNVCRHRLYRLRPTNLAAIGSHRAVQCHVLRLKRRDCYPLPHQPAAQRSDQRAFPCVGGCALHHHSCRYFFAGYERNCGSAIDCAMFA